MIELQRATDARFLNYVANHPDVRDGLLLERNVQLDYAPALKNQSNVALIGEHGGMLFHCLLPGLYEVHTQVLLSGRGEWTLAMAQSALHWMFARTNATEIMTRVPEGNKGALTLTLNLGAVREHTIQRAVTVGGRKVDWTIYRLTTQDWIRTAPMLEELGEHFHAELEAKARRAGVQVQIHPHDPWHDRHVGAAYAMFLGGQPLKAIGYYNRWAAMALAPMARLLSVDPEPVVDIGEAKLVVRNGGFEILKGN